MESFVTENGVAGSLLQCSRTFEEMRRFVSTFSDASSGRSRLEIVQGPPHVVQSVSQVAATPPLVPGTYSTSAAPPQSPQIVPALTRFFHPVFRPCAFPSFLLEKRRPVDHQREGRRALVGRLYFRRRRPETSSKRTWGGSGWRGWLARGDRDAKRGPKRNDPWPSAKRARSREFGSLHQCRAFPHRKRTTSKHIVSLVVAGIHARWSDSCLYGPSAWSHA